jgi:hypothetical protein
VKVSVVRVVVDVEKLGVGVLVGVVRIVVVVVGVAVGLGIVDG